MKTRNIFNSLGNTLFLLAFLSAPLLRAEGMAASQTTPVISEAEIDRLFQERSMKAFEEVGSHKLIITKLIASLSVRVPILKLTGSLDAEFFKGELESIANHSDLAFRQAFRASFVLGTLGFFNSEKNDERKELIAPFLAKYMPHDTRVQIAQGASIDHLLKDEAFHEFSTSMQEIMNKIDEIDSAKRKAALEEQQKKLAELRAKTEEVKAQGQQVKAAEFSNSWPLKAAGITAAIVSALVYAFH